MARIRIKHKRGNLTTPMCYIKFQALKLIAASSHGITVIPHSPIGNKQGGEMLMVSYLSEELRVIPTRAGIMQKQNQDIDFFEF